MRHLSLEAQIAAVQADLHGCEQEKALAEQWKPRAEEAEAQIATLGTKFGQTANERDDWQDRAEALADQLTWWVEANDHSIEQCECRDCRAIAATRAALAGCRDEGETGEDRARTDSAGNPDCVCGHSWGHHPSPGQRVGPRGERVTDGGCDHPTSPGPYPTRCSCPEYRPASVSSAEPPAGESLRQIPGPNPDDTLAPLAEPPAGECERIEHREGIFEVYDHEGRYQGCIGSEKWAALVQAERAEGREAERVNRWWTRVRDTEEGGEREWLDPERLSSLEAVAEAAREVLPPSPHLYRRGPTKALWEALVRLDAVSAGRDKQDKNG